MYKFPDSSSQGYRTVAEALIRYSREAPAVVAKRVSEAREMLSWQRSIEVAELMGGS